MAGASSAIEDWIEPRIPLTRIRCWDGVICGTSADTAGIWTPAPAERTARVTKISHGSVNPASMINASASVDAAIVASARITRRLRL